MQTKWIAHITALMTALCFLSAAHAYVVVASNLAYPSPGDTTYNRMDIYAPNTGAASSTATVILLHGGNYDGGDKSDFTAICQRLADLGYVSITMNYNLAVNGPGYPQAIYDVYSVIGWVRTTGGAQYHLPDKIIMGGASAGATVASTAALSADVPGAFLMPPILHPRGYSVDGLFHDFGRADLVWNVQTYGQVSVIIGYLGVPMTDSASQALYAQASAITYVNPCSPPTVLYHSDNDAIVPFGNSQRLTNALLAAGVPADLHVAHTGHNLDASGGDPGTADTIAAAIPWMLTNGQPGCGRSGQGPTTGACCTTTACSVILHGACSGTYLGDSTNCTPDVCPHGACCTSTSCGISTGNLCWGLYLGDGTACNPDVCPRGACCDDGGSTCTIVIQSDCGAALWMQPGTVCNPSPCPAPSACCNSTTGLCSLTYQVDCDGTWFASLNACTPDPCPHPAACCAATGGTCTFLSASDCANANGTWNGAGTNCSPTNPCPQPGACCGGSSCSISMQADCQTLWMGPNTLCTSNPCSQVLACCSGVDCSLALRSGCSGLALTGYLCTPGVCQDLATPGTCCIGATCSLRPRVNCSASQQLFIAAQNACNGAGNSTTPCCIADFNKDSHVTVQDLFSFLSAWFAKAPTADAVHNGAAIPTVESLFRFLGAWFAKCPA